MLYQPTFPSPYLETIDVTNPAGNIFKCLINPKNKVIGYKINILSNVDNTLYCQLKGWLEDTNDTQVHKKAYSLNGGTDWQEFTTIPEEDSILPVVGNYSDESWLQVILPSDIDFGLSNNNDYKWNITLIQKDFDIKILSGKFVSLDSTGSVGSRNYEIQLTTKIKAENMVIKVGGETKPILKTWNTPDSTYITVSENFSQDLTDNTSYEIFSSELTSYDYYFKARKTPIVTFEVPDTITSSSNTFTASIDRENISLYRFDLYLGADLIDTSEDIYSNNISYTYDGFISGNRYSLKLTVTTEDKETIIEERDFSVSYNISHNTIFVEAEMDKTINGVYLDYSSQVSIRGLTKDSSNVSYAKYKNVNDDIPETSNSVRLDKGQVLYWNSINDTKDLEILSNSTTLIHWHGDLGYTGKIAELSSNTLITEKVSIGYDSKNFYYKIGTDDIVYYNPYTNGTARVIAGADDYSVGGQILAYTNEEDLIQITIPLSEKVKVGMYISILGERKLITDVVSATETVITIESAFDSDITSGQNFFIYDELRCYIFSDDDTPQDTDIFVENDIGHNYWWLIVIMRNEVRFIKTKRYIDTVVSK